MTYKENIQREMYLLGKRKKVVFLGQGILEGHDRFYGTLGEVDAKKCIEFPIAENLMMGTAIGLAMQGYFPVVLFQRMDFMLIASDQIINHLSLIPQMSGGQWELPMIIRACVGSQDKKFDVGVQHNKDLSHVFVKYIDTKLYEPGDYIKKYDKPKLIIEHKDLYTMEVSNENGHLTE